MEISAFCLALPLNVWRTVKSTVVPTMTNDDNKNTPSKHPWKWQKKVLQHYSGQDTALSNRILFMETCKQKANDLFIYLGFYVAFNTVQVISRRVVGRAEETSTYSSLGLCTVNCRPMASNYQLSHLRRHGDRTPASEVGGESVTTLPPWPLF